jgi:hypothetical protein
MSRAGLEPAIPATKRPQTHARQRIVPNTIHRILLMWAQGQKEEEEEKEGKEEED